MGVTGNGLVIFVTSYKMKTTVNSIWFLNLAIADFIFSMFLIFDIAADLYKNIFLYLGKVIHACCYFVFLLNMFASVFFLTVISVDRCLCTWMVVWVQNKRSLVKARLICIFVWILSICCSISSFTLMYLQIFFPVALYTFMFMVSFLIPFLITASSYIAIGMRVKSLKRGKQLRSYRVIISVVLAFFICWFPFHVHKLCLISAFKYNWSDSAKRKLSAATPFVYCLAHLNSCLNPMLYVFMCNEFKVKLKKSLLLVLEAAFTEEHLSMRSPSLPHTSQCHQVPSVLIDDTTI
ncbi:C3a anaphylatoxin chemotactic receptor-like [Paramisgurnus dabryanus]|uniref:C3a anaphylatoxin chemotactic receptor-like n=1 Tax=Paramisgurnus dabryanus TaxID=90735 RepID=UPI003CCF0770